MMKIKDKPYDRIMHHIDRLDALSNCLQVLEQYPAESIVIDPHAYATVGKMMEESIVQIVSILSNCKIKEKKER